MFSREISRHRLRLTFWISVRMGPLLRSRLSVDDAVQETLIEAYRSRSAFRYQGAGSLRRWLFAIAENRLRDLHKYHTAQKRDPGKEVGFRPVDSDADDPATLLLDDGTSPSAGAARAELSGFLVHCLDGLPEILRDIVLQRIVEECSYREIARRLGKSPPSGLIRTGRLR